MGATNGSSDNKLGESDTVEITGKIMVVAIIFLFMVVVFVLLLHLYAKWFWWQVEEENTASRPSSRRRRRRRFVFAPGQDPVVYGPHQIGLDPAVLRSLPVLVFQPEDFKDGLECAVCLSEIVQGEKARLLPKCNHGFHVECIDMWFQSHSTCPLCRNPVAFSEASKPCSSSNAEENVSGNSESSEAENLGVIESSNFPTNVLVWGNQTQVSSFGVSLEEGTSQQQPPCSPSSSSASDGVNNSRCHGMLVIDIPNEFTSSSLSPSASRCAEDELKSPMTSRLKSFKRLLSRDRKLSPCSPSSMDVEQAQS